ncbi:MAG TPA: DNA-formamidopyrimidine glycosylase family protein [Acidimicrobiales bacterium]|nr:DNA-formamidopyrimidine glycosylase family protein [Acidimicrobiales bacterium]
MPELPEVEALTRFLHGRVAGRSVERCELGAIAALKTVDPPLSALVGRRAASCTRRGKYVCLELDGVWLVVHLARGGWVRWRDKLPPDRVRPGRGPLALRVGLDGASGFDITEMGTEKRLALWVVGDPDEVDGVATLGVEPLEPGFDADVLAGLLAGAAGNVKTVLASQSVIAGIGNAYSDEILHVARLSPFKPARNLERSEVERLHAAVVGVLGDAVARAVGQEASELKGDKKRAMRVHGRTGEVCPECGDVVREVSFATKSLQYCATCQTGGKPLADRRLSRLLR